MKLRAVLSLLGILTVLTACAGGAGHVAQSGGARTADVITLTEIEATTGVANAYELVQRLRPNFLISRGRTSIQDPTAGQVTVYVDNTRMGDVSTLRGIAVASVREIRRLSAGEATSRFGTGNSGGALVVTLR